jgi:hypothetical protein
MTQKFKLLFGLLWLGSNTNLQSAVSTLEIWTNNVPMPDPITIQYDPTITTNHELFMQIQAATGNPPENLDVDLGAGLKLPNNNDLVDETKFLMRTNAGKPKVVAINRV